MVGEDKVVVDLVGNDGEAVAVGDLEDGGQVLAKIEGLDIGYDTFADFGMSFGS